MYLIGRNNIVTGTIGDLSQLIPVIGLSERHKFKNNSCFHVVLSCVLKIRLILHISNLIVDSCISCMFYSSPFFQTAASNLFFGKKKNLNYSSVFWCIPPAERERERGEMNWGSSFFLRVPRGLHSDRDERILGLRERQNEAKSSESAGQRKPNAVLNRWSGTALTSGNPYFINVSSRTFIFRQNTLHLTLIVPLSTRWDIPLIFHLF